MNEITSILPPKYAAYFAALIVAVQFVGRAYHALASGKGIIGAWRAFLYGNTEPPQRGPTIPTSLIVACLALSAMASQAQTSFQLPAISLDKWTAIGGYGQSFDAKRKIAFGDIVYNYNKNVGIIVGEDQLWAKGQRQANAIKGGLTLQATIHPFAFIGSTPLTNLVATPFATELLATPKNGSGIGNLTTGGMNFSLCDFKNLELGAGAQIETRNGQGFWDGKYWLAHLEISRRF